MLSGVHVYYFSLFWVPSSVCKSLEKFMRDFLWEGMDEGKGSHLVSWKAIGRPVHQGGWRLVI